MYPFRASYSLRFVYLVALLVCALAACEGELAPPSESGDERIEGHGSQALSASDPWVTRFGLTAAQYQAETEKWVAQGYRVSDVSGYEDAGSALYSVIYDKTSGPAWQARHGLTAAQYQSTLDTLSSQGYRPVLVNGYSVSGSAYFAAIFLKDSSVAWIARHGQTGTQLQGDIDTLPTQGYRLTHVSYYSDDGKERYAAIWEKRGGIVWQVYFGMSAASYQSTVSARAAEGYRVVKVSGAWTGGMNKYAAIFHKVDGVPTKSTIALTGTQYQRAIDDLSARGYRPMVTAAHTNASGPSFHLVWNAMSGDSGSGALFFDASKRGALGQLCKLGETCNRASVTNDHANLTGLVCGAELTCVNPFAGVTGTAYGSARGNRCAHNVEAQFGDTFAGGDTLLYGYRDGDLPYDVAGNHVQSFVRLPIDDAVGSDVWFAAGWGAKRDGAIIYFVDSGLPEGEWGEALAGGDYASKIGAVSDHPGGMQAIGNYLVIAREIEGDDSDNAYFDVLDVSNPRKPVRHASMNIYEAGGVNRVSAVGVARVTGGYLFVANRSSTGGDYTYYAFFARDLRGASLQLVGTFTGMPAGSENLSLLTDCDTGRLYAIGSTADTDVVRDLWDQTVGWFSDSRGNQWVLYLVTANGMTPKDWAKKPPYSSACNARAAGTAFVDRDGRMHIYCHEMNWGDHVEGGEFQDWFNYYGDTY